MCPVNSWFAIMRSAPASSGFMIAEAAPVSRYGIAYAGAPGIYADEQIAGWRKVTDAVHAKGARIFLQLWHSGRQSHPDIIEGRTPIGPSALRGRRFWLLTRRRSGVRASPCRRDPTRSRSSCRCSAAEPSGRCSAGFDGVELHSANGYLTDQFLQDGSNVRTDAYGGSIENRCRFVLHVVQALVDVWGGNRVAVRLSPSGQFGGIFDSDPARTFGHLAEALNRFGLAYLHVIEPRIKGHRGDRRRVRPLSPRRRCGGSSRARSSPPAASTARVPTRSSRRAMPT